MNHKLQLVAATLAGVLVTVAAGGIAAASMGASMGRGPAGHFARADADGDGIVTRAEWIAAANARFDKFDTNHDSKLAVGEIPPAPARGHGHQHGSRDFEEPADQAATRPGNAS